MNYTYFGASACLSTDTCIYWCEQQHFSHNWELMWLIAIAFITLTLGIILLRHKAALVNYLIQSDLTPKQIKAAFMFFLEFTWLILLGFIIAWLWYA